jgi:hypothetical protein
MRRWRVVTSAAVLVLAGGAAGAQQLPLDEQYHLRLEYGRFTSEPDGQVQNGHGDTEGSVVDL